MARVRRPSNKKDGSKPQSSGQVRIIAGQWRGRRLPVADVTGLRPTTDRVRETLFNWLMHDIDGARVLDCFSGSGALGLEALSRYASHATLLELDKGAAKQLQKNLKSLNCSNAEALNTNAFDYLKRGCDTPFNVVFVDPPFRQDLYQQVINLLDQNGFIANDGWIYLESEAEIADLELPPSWRLHREKRSGQVLSRLYQQQSTEL